jgi:hypothetical protein
MSDLILLWVPPISQIVLLVLQIYTYRRTSHYSLALLAVSSVIGLLSAVLARVLHSEALYPRLSMVVFDVMIVLYTAYIMIGVWGTAALVRSYIRLTDSNKAPTQAKLVE